MPSAHSYPNSNDPMIPGVQGRSGAVWGGPHLAHVRESSGEESSNNISHTLEKQRKDDFLSMASHELKTPITTLKAFLQMVSTEDGQHAIVSKVHLKKMVDQVDRLTRLVSDLLEVSKIQKGEIEFENEQVDVDLLVHEMIAEAENRHPSHAFTVTGSSKCMVKGDRARLGQAIAELLNNAVKFSPDSNLIEVNVACRSGEVEIIVRDHGIGMQPSDQSHIFERYYRVLKDPARPFPGLGVGLYIVSEIIRHHEGHIAVSSIAGEGSSFTLSLPIAEPVVNG
ncbi:MAG: HAMP domain-containing histidine kinase [Bacteroidota bacterium]|nr:HAMP domain-containing histidine kinase [Bacteroidota bacterium]